MTDRSDKAQRPVDAVSSPELTRSSTASTALQGSLEATAFPENGEDSHTGGRVATQGSGLRRVTVTKGASGTFSEGDLEGDKPSEEARRPAEPTGDPYIGCTVDARYLVEKVLGEGGMGIVYRCTHSIIGKKVAMKVLRADLARNEEVTERFLNEAKSASSIGSPHIIDISDFGRLPDGSTYFIMEYLEGETLANVVDSKGPVPIPRLVHVAEQLAEGLDAAHRAGIIHRDLKPDNIFLVPRDGRDFVKILDFGIAKASSTSGKLTQAGQVFGTPHYMSPEQAAGTAIDHRADIYSLGVILYEMASGKLPFDAENFMGILTQHMYKAPIPIRSLVPPPQDVPPALEAIILKCLSKVAEQRYATMHDLADDLRRFREGHLPQAVADLIGPSKKGFSELLGGKDRTPSSRPLVRSRVPLYAALGVGALGIAGTGVWLARGPSDAPAKSLPTVETLVGREPAAPTTPAAPTMPAAAEPARAEPEQVVLAVAPLDARVYRGEEDLGTSPVVVEVPPGETIHLVVKKSGYKDTEIELDGSEHKLSVALERVRPAVRPKPPPTTNPRPAPSPSRPRSSSGSDIVNPWE